MTRLGALLLVRSRPPFSRTHVREGRPAIPGRGLFRHSRWDAVLVALALLHGAVLLVFPSLLTVALGIWWNSNTVSHNALHRPFFRPRWLNRLFALYLTVLLGVPQSVWRARHLAHHAGVAWRPRWTRATVLDVSVVLLLWTLLLVVAPRFFLTAYVPGYLLGLLLCAVHGHYEHARGTVSHHGLLYNLLFFNDGYHVEHHAAPGRHWAELPRPDAEPVPTSRWPAVLRWLDGLSLDGLERLVLRSPRLQRFVLDRHERAFRALVPEPSRVRSVAVIGGGLFPRTPLLLRRLLPQARIVVIDRDEQNLQTARPFLKGDVEFVHGVFDPRTAAGFDMVVIPLAYVGDRAALYRRPPAPVLLVHDWIWRRRGRGVAVSWLLLKRLNRVDSCMR